MPYTILSDQLNGRNNNLNLIRVSAALLVLVSHSFAIVSGDTKFEPLRRTYGLTLGSVSVDVFFIVSGLLVTQSLLKRSSAVAFAWARTLRIWPGLLISLFLVAYVIGMIVTDLPAQQYLLSTEPLRFILQGVKLASSLPELPGVFTTNPFGNSVNISLWTLPIEVRMYAYLLVAWIISRASHRLKNQTFLIIITLAFMYYSTRHFASQSGTIEASAPRLPFMFFSGALACLFSKYVKISEIYGILAISILISSIVCAGSFFFIAYSVTLWYIVLWLAYRPRGLLRIYNLVGDYSYGLYIYAWPIQQATISLLPRLSTLEHIAISGAVTLCLAIISWHLIERPALNFTRLLRRVHSP